MFGFLHLRIGLVYSGPSFVIINSFIKTQLFPFISLAKLTVIETVWYIYPKICNIQAFTEVFDNSALRVKKM